MDKRLKKDTSAGRENRGVSDLDRAPVEDSFVSAEERRKMFRSEWMQEALPNPPAIPGFHLCWLSTTNQYDPIHKRVRLGYTPVKADEVSGFDTYRVKSGEHTGLVACNEMILYKLPEELYQEMMVEMHHNAPMEEQEKIRIQQEQLLNAKDSNGKRLGMVEGDGMNFDQSAKVPTFN